MKNHEITEKSSWNINESISHVFLFQADAFLPLVKSFPFIFQKKIVISVCMKRLIFVPPLAFRGHDLSLLGREKRAPCGVSRLMLLRPLIKSSWNIQVSIGMDYVLGRRFPRARLQSPRHCVPAGLSARAIPAGVAAFHCHWNNVLKRTILSENAILTMSKDGCLKMKTKTSVF